MTLLYSLYTIRDYFGHYRYLLDLGMFAISEIFYTEEFGFGFEFLYKDSDLWERLIEGVGFEEFFDVL